MSICVESGQVYAKACINISMLEGRSARGRHGEHGDAYRDDLPGAHVLVVI